MSLFDLSGKVAVVTGSSRVIGRAIALRLADGPDEVHNRTIARLELGRYTNART